MGMCGRIRSKRNTQLVNHFFCLFMRYLYYLFIVPMCSSCIDIYMDRMEDLDGVNQAGDTIVTCGIYVSLTSDPRLKKKDYHTFIYNDSLYETNSPYDISILCPHEKREISCFNSISPERYFKEIDTFSIFIFNKDTFDAYSWDELRNGKRVLRRYDLSGTDVRTLNSVIPYPPTEEMRYMKMWPPYEE